MTDVYVKGAWNVICDRCGFKYKNTQVRLEWTNLRVCSGSNTNDCWEPRHPQERLKGKIDRQSPPWVRPEPPDTFLSVNEVTPEDL